MKIKEVLLYMKEGHLIFSYIAESGFNRISPFNERNMVKLQLAKWKLHRFKRSSYGIKKGSGLQYDKYMMSISLKIKR